MAGMWNIQQLVEFHITLAFLVLTNGKRSSIWASFNSRPISSLSLVRGVVQVKSQNLFLGISLVNQGWETHSNQGNPFSISDFPCLSDACPKEYYDLVFKTSSGFSLERRKRRSKKDAFGKLVSSSETYDRGRSINMRPWVVYSGNEWKTYLAVIRE